MTPLAATHVRKHALPRLLRALLVVYALASLIHFAHNAAYLASYPNMPHGWTAAGVCLAWIAMTAIGAIGVVLFARESEKAALCVIVVYATCGLDSLGHYVLAPISSHTHAMNATILLEVGAAALLLIEALRQLARRVFTSVFA